MSKRPIWRRLKDFKCPFCARDLTPFKTWYQCPLDACEFKVSDQKMKQVIEDMNAPRGKSFIQQEEETQEELSKM